VAEYDEMVELGESLGREVLRVLDSSIDEICPNLYTDSLQVSIPFSRMPGEEEIEAAQNSANQYLRRWAMGIKNEKSLPTSVDMEVQRFDLGTDLSILAISAEVVVEYGPLLKSIVPDMRIIPVGYANGVIGYVGVREHYKEGGYEVDGWYIHYLYPSPFALEVQDRIHDGVERLYFS
jgi:hypothetical protein